MIVFLEQMHVPVPQHQHPAGVPIAGGRGRPSTTAGDQAHLAAATAASAHQHS